MQPPSSSHLGKRSGSMVEHQMVLPQLEIFKARNKMAVEVNRQKENHQIWLRLTSTKVHGVPTAEECVRRDKNKKLILKIRSQFKDKTSLKRNIHSSFAGERRDQTAINQEPYG